jgi:hypothetical protein
MAINPYSFIAVCNLILWMGCAIAFYRVAQLEDVPGWYWAGPSLVVYYLTMHFLGFGPIGNLIGQFLLLIAIGGVRAWHDSRSG